MTDSNFFHTVSSAGRQLNGRFKIQDHNAAEPQPKARFQISDFRRRPRKLVRGANIFIVNRRGHVKAATIIGIVLIIVGAIALAYGGITYTSHKKVIDMGPIQASTKTRKTIPLPPVLGGVLIAGGIVVVAAGRKSG
jgi:uncharacterized membrane protein YidH (DUF202 family)